MGWTKMDKVKKNSIEIGLTEKHCQLKIGMLCGNEAQSSQNWCSIKTKKITALHRKEIVI